MRKWVGKIKYHSRNLSPFFYRSYLFSENKICNKYRLKDSLSALFFRCDSDFVSLCHLDRLIALAAAAHRDVIAGHVGDLPRREDHVVEQPGKHCPEDGAQPKDFLVIPEASDHSGAWKKWTIRY